MANKKQFQLNSLDINLIEKCLRREIGTISNRTRHSQHNEAKEDLDLIQSLLGKLHNQKTWYAGTSEVTSMLRG